MEYRKPNTEYRTKIDLFVDSHTGFGIHYSVFGIRYSFPCENRTRP